MKGLDEFYGTGHKKSVARCCRACVLARMRAHHLTIPGRAQRLLSAAKARSGGRPGLLGIDLQWVEERLSRMRCEVTGLPLVLDAEGSSPWAPSLDQIVPGLGYTPGNTRLVCHMFNCAKNSFTDADVRTMARALLQ